MSVAVRWQVVDSAGPHTSARVMLYTAVPRGRSVVLYRAVVKWCVVVCGGVVCAVCCVRERSDR